MNEVGGTIIVADDHPLFRQALIMAVQRACPQAQITETGTLEATLQAVREARDLRLILLDLRMPGSEGFSGLAMIHSERPDTPVLIVSAADSRAAVDARRFGAAGFVGKNESLEAIEAAIRTALSGQAVAVSGEADEVAAKVAELTPMQLRVLLGVLNGRLNKQIAFELGISEATVKAHMTAVMRKLDVRNRTQAVLVARALGLEIEH